MDDVTIVTDGDGGGGDEPSGEERPKDTRSWVEIYEPEGAKGTWRELPGLIVASIRLVWSAGRRELIVTSALSLVAALAVGAQVFAGQAALQAVLDADGDLASILPQLGVLIGVTMLLALVQTVEEEQSRVLGELTSRHALDRVLDVATGVDLLAFEEPTFHDRLRRAQGQGAFRGLQIVHGLLGIIGASVTVITLLVTLAALQPLLLPFVLVGYLPLWVAAARNTQDYYRFIYGFTPNERTRGYLSGLMLSRGSAKEVRAFQLAGFLRSRYDRLYDERIAELRQLARRRTWRGLAGSLLSASAMAAALIALSWLLVSGRMSAAATGAAVFALYQLTSQLRTLHFSAASLYEATLFIRDYTSFLELEQPRVERTERRPERFTGVRLQDVTFRYPDM